MCWLGAGPGAVVAPIGAAVVALTVERVTDGIAAANLGEDKPDPVAPAPGHEAEEAPAAPYWVERAHGVRVRVGGERPDGYVHPGARTLLPVVCAQRAQEQARVLAEGQAAVAQLEAWRDRERAASTRTRMRTDALAAAAGGTARALPYSSRTRADLGSARPVRTPELAHTDDGGEASERLIGAAEAKRMEGLATRERVREHMDAHPAHTAEQIAEHVGVTASTVRRHQRAMRTRANGVRS